jgi:SAM-dependent methyltransferase
MARCAVRAAFSSGAMLYVFALSVRLVCFIPPAMPRAGKISARFPYPDLKNDLLLQFQLQEMNKSMNWKNLQPFPWIDTRARFVAGVPSGGSLLDIGSSDGETLRHIAELRPDLKYYATDLSGKPEAYPANCTFHRGDIQKDPLPWKDGSISAITCMHLVEHLNNHTLLAKEAKRLLQPGGRIYVETPHPKTLMLSSPRGEFLGKFTMNFYDDTTHTKIVSLGALAQVLREAGLAVTDSGVSRNLVFAASHLLYKFMPPSRQKYTAQAHWIGWSAYLIAEQQP